MMIKIILIIAVVIINSPFQPGDFSTGSTTGTFAKTFLNKYSLSTDIAVWVLPDCKRKFRKFKSQSWRDLKAFIQYPCNLSFPGAFQLGSFWRIFLLDIIKSSSRSRFKSSNLIFESHSASLLWILLIPHIFLQNSLLSFSSGVEFVFSLLLTPFNF